MKQFLAVFLLDSQYGKIAINSHIYNQHKQNDAEKIAEQDALKMGLTLKQLKKLEVIVYPFEKKEFEFELIIKGGK